MTKLSFKPNFSTGWRKIISLNCIFSKLRSSVKKKLGRDFLELTGVDHSDPHTYFRKINTRFMLVYFFFYLPKWLMTSLWLLSRIRFGVVEMGFEPKNVTKITSYHITSTQYVLSESSRVVVGCFSFVMLCEKGTNDSLVHFASPPFTFVYRYIPIQYVYEHFGGPRSNIRFWGGTCHYHLNCVGMYLVLTIQGSSQTHTHKG